MDEKPEKPDRTPWYAIQVPQDVTNTLAFAGVVPAGDVAFEVLIHDRPA
jgi:hypothetical protein